jgi:hypothetical protein
MFLSPLTQRLRRLLADGISLRIPGRRILFVVASAFVLNCRGAEQHVLAGTQSPDKKTAIVEEQTDDGDRDYYFVQNSNHKKLGYVLPADQRGQVSNVAIVASWNAKSSKVALLVFYGTKLNELLLFSKDASGQFQSVALQEPDAEAIYRKRTGGTIPMPGDGYSENAVGPWLDDKTVCMVSGEAKQTENPDLYTHLLVIFKASVKDKRAVISDLQLKGPLSDEASTEFQKKWGTRYFEADDE